MSWAKTCSTWSRGSSLIEDTSALAGRRGLAHRLEGLDREVPDRQLVPVPWPDAPLGDRLDARPGLRAPDRRERGEHLPLDEEIRGIACRRGEEVAERPHRAGVDQAAEQLDGRQPDLAVGIGEELEQRPQGLPAAEAGEGPGHLAANVRVLVPGDLPDRLVGALVAEAGEQGDRV